ncbi:unnamed protein product, partial [Dovyalis caffra]
IFSDKFFIKDLDSQEILHVGTLDKGLYKFSLDHGLGHSSPIQAHSATRETWHAHLGHA